MERSAEESGVMAEWLGERRRLEEELGERNKG